MAIRIFGAQRASLHVRLRTTGVLPFFRLAPGSKGKVDWDTSVRVGGAGVA